MRTTVSHNRGMEQAKGEWIAFLDSDDLWDKNKLVKQLNWLAHQPDYHAVHTNEIWLRNGVRVNPMDKHRKYSGAIFRQCLPFCIVSPSSAILRAELLREVGGFDESMPVCEDYDLWLRIARQYPFHLLAENGAGMKTSYRINIGAWTVGGCTLWKNCCKKIN
jgi:cellulose synthase/poly-beta-1,6-N-acetylglucosamine synthase-like glycosyltransferase